MVKAPPTLKRSSKKHNGPQHHLMVILETLFSLQDCFRRSVFKSKSALKAMANVILAQAFTISGRLLRLRL
ncbi:Uncharacterized protein APZ42_002542 [Daphnia magna]|uniref:Uncharacterized protein n=1 Tax=Daphnia magna TaxID=35525 RepID=A0A164I7C1_9CRUS|nr:Uncharacterized protein APZ42_002542 [Daphnia magna]